MRVTQGLEDEFALELPRETITVAFDGLNEPGSFGFREEGRLVWVLMARFLFIERKVKWKKLTLTSDM